jgi:hypothetical protein
MLFLPYSFTKTTKKHMLLAASVLLGEKDVRVARHAWHALYYGVVGVWGLRILPDFEAMWTNPNSDRDSVAGFMFVQVLWYVHCFFESLVLDASRHDFAMMMVHHVLALALIVGSYNAHWHQVGVVVCVVHDVADIVINVAKLVHKAAPARKQLHGVLLVVLGAVWGATRVGMLAWIVWRAAWAERGWFALALGGLFAMQVVWGLGLARIILTWMRGRGVRDVFDE